jgi:sugar phosphate isomerase/epimerase
MKLGLYNAVLHDRPLADAIKIIADLGLSGIEINTGGFLPAVHVPTFDDILVSDTARDDFLGVFDGTGVSIAGLNCNGNPLHPNPAIGPKHAEDIRRSIRLAERLGQHIVADFWREIDRLAGDHDVKVALELHPQNVVFNSASVHKLIELTGATQVGVELDASHLFWQQMDPVRVVEHLGDLVLHAAAKDVRINTEYAAINGVLDNSFRRLSADEPRTNLGGDEWANEWPKQASWDFVALGKGHDVGYWTEFLRALYQVDPEMMVNIEHEDTELGRVEGVAVAAEVLKAADAALRADLVS